MKRIVAAVAAGLILAAGVAGTASAKVNTFTPKPVNTFKVNTF